MLQVTAKKGKKEEEELHPHQADPDGESKS